MMNLTERKGQNKESSYYKGKDLYELVREYDYIEYSLLKKALNIKEITLKKQLSRLVKQGYLEKIKRDFYVPKESKLSEFKLGCILFKGYVGLESALYLHKMIDILPFTIYVMNSKSSKEYKFRNYTLKGFYTKQIYGTTIINNYLVSTKAKTIYDCLKYNHSDLNTLYLALNKLNSEDLIEFLNYLKQEKSDSFKQKVGFLFDKLETKGKDVKKIIDYCKQFVKNKVYIDKDGKYNKEWGVIVKW